MIETICEKTDGVMNNCLVSVIIPVYNVPEEFLNKSMSSLLAQSYDEIEIIMVDDGSEKVTADLCDVYAAKDSRIKVIHLDNSGVSRARNHGTAISTGKYVMYVDGDDILAPKAIEEAVNTAEALNRSKSAAPHYTSSYQSLHFHMLPILKKSLKFKNVTEKSVKTVFS